MNEDELIRRIHGLRCSEWSDSDNDSENDYDDEYTALKPPSTPMRALQEDAIKVEPFTLVTYKKLNVKRLCDKQRHKVDSKKHNKVGVTKLNQQGKKKNAVMENKTDRPRSPNVTLRLGDFLKVSPRNTKLERPRRKPESKHINLAESKMSELVSNTSVVQNNNNRERSPSSPVDLGDFLKVSPQRSKLKKTNSKPSSKHVNLAESKTTELVSNTSVTQTNYDSERSPSSTSLGDFLKVLPQNTKQKRPKRKPSSKHINLAESKTTELVSNTLHSPLIRDFKNCLGDTLINIKSINKRDLQSNLLTNPGL